MLSDNKNTKIKEKLEFAFRINHVFRNSIFLSLPINNDEQQMNFTTITDEKEDKIQS